MVDTIGIQNAPHWLNHSMVVVKEDWLAEDEMWVTNQLVTVGTRGTGTQARPDMGYTGKDPNVLKVMRAVQPGSVVAVLRASGREKKVNLPQEAEQLLLVDLNYIVQQIELLQAPPMTEEQQKAFLARSNAASQGS